MTADSIIPFAFEALPVRGALVHLRGAWQRMQRDHDYPPVVTSTLGQAAAASSLIAQSLKFDGAITLQVQGGSNLQMLVMQCTSEQDLRGMAVLEDTAVESFAELIAGAHCAITVDAGERPYQGIVEMQPESLATSLEHYFQRSVQVPSHVFLLADAAFAGGVLLQQMPGQPIDEDDWRRLGFMLETLQAEELAADSGVALIGKLFAEDDVRVYDSQPVRFRCRCSQQKAEDVLRMLGEAEARSALADTGELEIICEYCGRRRRFDSVDITRIFAENVVPAPESVQ